MFDRASHLARLSLLLALAGCPGGGEETTQAPTGTSSGGGGSSGGEGSTAQGTTSTPTTGASSTGAEPTTGSTSDATGSTSDATGSTGDPPVDPGFTPRARARVFLSGHSLTDDPLADYVLEVAASLGNDFNYNEQIGIGSPIRVRTLGDSWDNLDWPGYRKGKNRDGVDMDVIAELLDPQTLGPGERYDTLVITERHDILDTIRWEDTAGLLRHYHDRLIDGNAAGATLLYHSWLALDKAAPEAWIAHEKAALVAWECVADKVNHTLAAEGRVDRVVTLPVGAAMVRLVEAALAGEVAGLAGSTSERMDRIFSDDVHLTPLGVYYAALVTYAAVFRDSPIGAAVPAGVDSGPTADLQQIAWDFVRGYYTSPDFGPRSMEECRTFVSEQVCGSFWTLLGDPGKIGNCEAHFADPGAQNGSNPFRWPDPGLMPWPPP